MTDEQNQRVLRAFASAADPAPRASTDDAFVAGVATDIRRRRRREGRLRLLALALVLIVAAMLAPLVARAGGWLAGAAQWLANGAVDLALSPAGLVVIAAVAFALVFPAGIVVWALRRR